VLLQSGRRLAMPEMTARQAVEEAVAAKRIALDRAFEPATKFVGPRAAAVVAKVRSLSL
jgi:hypothetical protein